MLEGCIHQLEDKDRDLFVIPPPAIAPIAIIDPRIHLFVKKITRQAKNT